MAKKQTKKHYSKPANNVKRITNKDVIAKKNLEVIKREFIDTLTIDNLYYEPGYSFEEVRTLEFMSISPKNNYSSRRSSNQDKLRMILQDIDFLPDDSKDPAIKLAILNTLITNYFLLEIVHAQFPKSYYELIEGEFSTNKIIEILDDLCEQVEAIKMDLTASVGRDKEKDIHDAYLKTIFKLNKCSYNANKAIFGIFPHIQTITLTIPPFLYLPTYKLKFNNIETFTQFLISVNTKRFISQTIDSSLDHATVGLTTEDAKKQLLTVDNVTYFSRSSTQDIEVVDVTNDNISDVIDELLTGNKSQSTSSNNQVVVDNLYTYRKHKKAFDNSRGFTCADAIDSQIKEMMFECKECSFQHLQQNEMSGLIKDYVSYLESDILSKLHSAENTSFWHIELKFDLCINDSGVYDIAKNKPNFTKVLSDILQTKVSKYFEDRYNEPIEMEEILNVYNNTKQNSIISYIGNLPTYNIRPHPTLSDTIAFSLDNSSSSINTNLHNYVNIKNQMLPVVINTPETTTEKQKAQQMLDNIIKPMLANAILGYSFVTDITDIDHQPRQLSEKAINNLFDILESEDTKAKDNLDTDDILASLDNKIKVKDMDLTDPKQLKLLKDHLTDIYKINEKLYIKQITTRHHTNSFNSPDDKTKIDNIKAKLITVTLKADNSLSEIRYPDLIDFVSCVS